MEDKLNCAFCGKQIDSDETEFLDGECIDPTTVSGILGHSQVSTILNIYSHMFQENQAKTCDAVATALNFSKNNAVENNITQ